MEYLHVLAIEYYAKGQNAAAKRSQIVVENGYYSPTTSKQSRPLRIRVFALRQVHTAPLHAQLA